MCRSEVSLHITLEELLGIDTDGSPTQVSKEMFEMGITFGLKQAEDLVTRQVRAIGESPCLGQWPSRNIFFIHDKDGEVLVLEMSQEKTTKFTPEIDELRNFRSLPKGTRIIFRNNLLQ